MRLRNITGSREVIAESPYVVQEPWKHAPEPGMRFSETIIRSILRSVWEKDVS